MNEKAQPPDEKEKKVKQNWSHTWAVTEYFRKLTILLNAYLMISYEDDSGSFISITTAPGYEPLVRTLCNIDELNSGLARRPIQETETQVRQNWFTKLRTTDESFNSIVYNSIDSITFPTRKEVSQWVTQAKTETRKNDSWEPPNVAKLREQAKTASWSGWEDSAPVENLKKDKGKGNGKGGKTVRPDVTPQGKEPGRLRWTDRKDSWCKNHFYGTCRYLNGTCNRAHTQEEYDAARKKYGTQ